MLQELRADYELRTRRLEAALAELIRSLDSVPDEGQGDIEGALARIRERLPRL